jgi:hypothetical protein
LGTERAVETLTADRAALASVMVISLTDAAPETWRSFAPLRDQV